MNLTRFSVFSRINFSFDSKKNVDRIEFTLPDGSVITEQTYKQMGVLANYDKYGYYHIKTVEKIITIGKFIPTAPGRYTWLALSGKEGIESGEFEVYDDNKPAGYVLKGDDPRYFMLSSSHSFVPVGITLRAKSSDYYSSDEISLGIREYTRRIKRFAESGGNLVCLSLTDPLFNIRTEYSSITRHEAFYNLWHVIECCRENNVKVKLTLESFKTLKNDPSFAKRDCRVIKDAQSARRIYDIKEWLNDPKCFDEWFDQIHKYLLHYKNDPVIMAFEVWDEIDLIDAPREDVLRFIKKAVEKIKEISPENMVTVGVGTLYSESDIKKQKEIFGNIDVSFLQTKRFLNHTAELSECRENLQKMSGSAIERMATKDKPLLLAETGAINPYSKKTFGLYSIDYRATILNDCAFTPFFKGAAGVGILSHVAEYIEPLNLYGCFKPFAQMLHNVKIHKQYFKPMEITRKKAKVYVLKGRSTTLIFVRAKDDEWQKLLNDPKRTGVIRGISLPSFSGKTARVYPVFSEDAKYTEIALSADTFTLPPFKYGYFIKIR